MAFVKGKQDGLSIRVAQYEDAVLIEMFQAALEHVEHGLLSEGPLVSLEREYRQQSSGAAVNAIRDVEWAVMTELAMRYCEMK